MRPEGKDCVYCGVPAQNWDHVVPRSVWETASSTGLDLSDYELDRSLTVPSCVECNLILGCEVFPTQEARTDKVRRALAYRYNDAIRWPERSETEVLGMDLLRRAKHLSMLGVGRRARARIAYRTTEDFDGACRAAAEIQLIAQAVRWS